MQCLSHHAFKAGYEADVIYEMNRMVVSNLAKYASFSDWHGEAYETSRLVNSYHKVRELLLQNISLSVLFCIWESGEQA